MREQTKDAKQERFVRIAQQRTQKVLEALRSLSNCASHASYDYTPEQVEQIFDAIAAELEQTRSLFGGKRHFSLATRQGSKKL